MKVNQLQSFFILLLLALAPSAFATSHIDVDGDHTINFDKHNKNLIKIFSYLEKGDTNSAIGYLKAKIPYLDSTSEALIQTILLSNNNIDKKKLVLTRFFEKGATSNNDKILSSFIQNGTITEPKKVILDKSNRLLKHFIDKLSKDKETLQLNNLRYILDNNDYARLYDILIFLKEKNYDSAKKKLAEVGSHYLSPYYLLGSWNFNKESFLSDDYQQKLQEILLHSNDILSYDFLNLKSYHSDLDCQYQSRLPLDVFFAVDLLSKMKAEIPFEQNNTTKITEFFKEIYELLGQNSNLLPKNWTPELIAKEVEALKEDIDRIKLNDLDSKESFLVNQFETLQKNINKINSKAQKVQDNLVINTTGSVAAKPNQPPRQIGASQNLQNNQFNAPKISSMNQPSSVTQSKDQLKLHPTITSIETSVPHTCTSKEVFKLAQDKLDPDQKEKFKEQYHSFFFFDRSKVAKELFTDGTLTSPQLYNVSGQYGIDGHQAAYEFLQNNVRDINNITTDDIIEMQRRIMSKEYINEGHIGTNEVPANSEGTLDDDIGKLRIDKEFYTKSVVNSNNMRRLDGSHLTNGKRTYQDIAEDNPFLQIQDTQILYPYFLGANDNNVLANPYIMKRLTPQLRAKLLKNNGVSLQQNQELNQQLITDLLNYSLNELKQNLALAKKDKNPILAFQAAARFHRDFMSIHPFANGNGRVGRIILSDIIESFGYPAPIWPKWEEDIELSEEQFIDSLYDGIVLSQNLHNFVCDRIEQLPQGSTGEDIINQFNILPLLGLEQDRTPMHNHKEIFLQDIRQWAARNGKNLLRADQYGNVKNRKEMNSTQDQYDSLRAAFTVNYIRNKKVPKNKNYFSIFPVTPIILPEQKEEDAQIESFENYVFIDDFEKLDQDKLQKMKIIIDQHTKLLEQDRVVYSWAANGPAVDGLIRADMNYRLQSQYGNGKTWEEYTKELMFMGPGIYYSDNPFDSLETGGIYKAERPQLTKITIKKGQPYIDYRDPETVADLTKAGIQMRDLVTLPLAISLDYPTNISNDPDNAQYRWGVLRLTDKDAVTIERANDENMSISDLFLLSKYPKKGRKGVESIKYIDAQLSKATKKWNMETLKDQNIAQNSYIWAPYGQCVQKSNNKIIVVNDYSLCLEATESYLTPIDSRNPIVKKRITPLVMKVVYQDPSKGEGPYVLKK